MHHLQVYRAQWQHPTPVRPQNLLSRNRDWNRTLHPESHLLPKYKATGLETLMAAALQREDCH